MRKQIPSIMLVVALVVAAVLFVTGNALGGALCVVAAIALLVATAARLNREGRLPTR